VFFTNKKDTAGKEYLPSVGYPKRVQLNRAIRIKQYLIEQLEIFERYVNLGESKDEFFEAVRKFRDSTVSFLSKSEVINQDDLNRLDKSLADIDTQKSAGYENKVYWNGTKPKYDKVKCILNDLILNMDRIKLPFSIWFRDYFSERSFVQRILVGVIASLLVALIIYLLSILT
jgi:hypothetical protein